MILLDPVVRCGHCGRRGTCPDPVACDDARAKRLEDQ